MEYDVQRRESGIALVTGAGGGIGAEVCKRLAARGLRIVAADIDAARATSLAQALGPQHVGLSFDVADEASVDTAFDRIESEYGSIRVVVCAAGLLQFEPNGQRPLIKSTELDLWNKSMAVNATGVFLCARAFLRHREPKPVSDGRFITFASVAAQLGGYRSSASYIAAKSAVLGFTKALAREVSSLGITVNSVSPGLIDTDMLRATVASSGAMEAAAASIPLGRIGTVSDVASAVDFLVSADAGYITGSVIDVNGGYRMQ